MAASLQLIAALPHNPPALHPVEPLLEFDQSEHPIRMAIIEEPIVQKAGWVEVSEPTWPRYRNRPAGSREISHPITRYRIAKTRKDGVSTPTARQLGKPTYWMNQENLLMVCGRGPVPSPGGTNSSNPLSSSGESGELPYCAAGSSRPRRTPARTAGPFGAI